MAMESLGDSLKQAFRKIAGLGAVDREAVEAIVRDIQRALLQADVDVELVLQLSSGIKKKMLEGKPPEGLTLKEYFIKTLYDDIVRFLGEEKADMQLKPQRVLLMGLFGSGKTTSCAKIAKWFKSRGLSVGMVACDTHRPAAQEQLRQLGKKLEVPVYSGGKNPEKIAQEALKQSKEDVLIFDSAGRDALDEKLAKELKEMGRIIRPQEVLLILPADIGQVARKQAEEFNRLVGITGIVITKLDGTAKGGGAIAAASVSGAKVKFIGAGEKPEDLELYDPQRFVSRLIGYGDLQGLLEKAKEIGIKPSEKLMKGDFDLKEFYEQIASVQKMGSLTKVMEMIPGMGGMKIPKEMLNVQEDKMKRWKFVIESMTEKERTDPEAINSSRVRRIAKGSGTTVEDTRDLLKYYKQTRKIMKLAKGGKGLKRGPLAQLVKQFGLKME
ncbi:MAG: signal recognition particle protein [Candidatus Aenigmarchaeota archaeon]|nr:signal recognition particle protein [Candidatus Aenigmarchaeota archaeon]